MGFDGLTDFHSRLTDDGSRLWAVRQLVRQRRAEVERRLDAYGWPWDPRASAEIDLLVTLEDTMNEQLDRALTPAAFDFAACSVCGEATPVPLAWVIAHEPAVAIHEGCMAAVANIEEESEAA